MDQWLAGWMDQLAEMDRDGSMMVDGCGRIYNGWADGWIIDQPVMDGLSAGSSIQRWLFNGWIDGWIKQWMVD